MAVSEKDKKIFAKNLQYYIEKFGKTQRDVAMIAEVSAPTVNEWLKCKKYPRMNRIQKLADYFGILKSDLIEEKLKAEDIKENDIIVDAVSRMEKDKEFFNTIERLMYDKEFLEITILMKNLKKEKLNAVRELL